MHGEDTGNHNMVLGVGQRPRSNSPLRQKAHFIRLTRLQGLFAISLSVGAVVYLFLFDPLPRGGGGTKTGLYDEHKMVLEQVFLSNRLSVRVRVHPGIRGQVGSKSRDPRR